MLEGRKTSKVSCLLQSRLKVLHQHEQLQMDWLDPTTEVISQALSQICRVVKRRRLLMTSHPDIYFLKLL